MTVFATPRSNVLTGAQVAQVARDAGFKGEALTTAVAIAYAETAGTLDAHAVGDIDLSEPGEQSTGLWQVNYRPSRDRNDSSRAPSRNFDPAANARSAYGISGGGTNFGPWSTYAKSAKHPHNNGAYKAYLTKATAAVAAVTGKPVAATTDSGTPLATAPAPSAPALPGDVTTFITDATVDLTTDRASQLTLTLTDRDHTLLASGRFAFGQTFSYDGIAWTVTSPTVGPGNSGIASLTVKASPTGVVRLREMNAPAQDNVSPTDYARARAASAGLGFVGQPLPEIARIEPQMVPDTSPDALPGATKLENGWDLIQRLATDQSQTLPCIAFEAGGTLFFGLPQYLAEHVAKVDLSYRGQTSGDSTRRVVAVTAVPRCEMTRNQTIGNSIIPRGVRIVADVERQKGIALRPGQRARLLGMPLFDAELMITRVSWQRGATTPVTVTTTDFPSIPGVGAVPIFVPAPQTSTPTDEQGDRINAATRTTVFGPHGDEVRYHTYKTPWGITVHVHDLIREQFIAACGLAKTRSSWTPKVIGSYSNRPNVNDPSQWSLHAWALAWDFYSTATYQSDVQGPTFAPDQAFFDAFESLGFYCGARFHGHKDYPHIEWASALPTTAQRTAASGANTETRRHSDGTLIGGL